MKSAAGRADRTTGAAVVCIVLAAVVLLTSRTVADPDLWGHVRFGLDILETGRPAQADRYSYVPSSQVWTNHEWLSEAIFALSFRTAGTTGLVALKVLLWLSMAAVMYRDLVQHGLTCIRAGIVVLFSLFLCGGGLGTIRPQVFTYGLLLLLLLALRAAERGRARLLLLVPVLFVAWANVHGGFIVGLAVLFGWLAAVVVLGLARRDVNCRPLLRTVVMATALTVAATLLNPHGYGLLRFLLQPATFVRPEISEWAPLRLLSTNGVVYLVGVIAGGTVLAVGRRRWTAMTVVGVWIALLPLVAARHGPLFGVAFPVVLAEHLGVVPRHRVTERPAVSRPAAWGVCVVAVAVVLVLLWNATRNLGCIRLSPADLAYPVRAVALLKTLGARGNLAVDFDWGEYVVWHLGPDVKVSVDGRRETAYDDAAYRVALRFTAGTGRWDDLLTKHRTDMALVRRGGPAFNLMKLSPGWTILYEDGISAVFMRNQSSLLREGRGAEAPSVPHDGAGLCFP